MMRILTEKKELQNDWHVLSLEDFSTEADRLEEELCGIFLEVLLSCTIRIQIL
jgi:hypothetical protein